MQVWEKVVIDDFDQPSPQYSLPKLRGVLMFVAIAGYYFLFYSIEQKYNETLNMFYLFLYTLLRIPYEHYILTGIGISVALFIKRYLNIPVPTEESLRRTKIVLAGYAVIWLVILLGQPTRMNTCYTISNAPVSTAAHTLFYQLKDLVTNDEITLRNEPCSLFEETENYLLITQYDVSIQSEYYDYIYLKNQKSIVPFPSNYKYRVSRLLEESGGKCTITCYKHTHIVKAVNGIDLTDL